MIQNPWFSRISSFLLLTLLSVSLVSLGFSQNGRATFKNGLNNYNGSEDFYTYSVDGGVFNSKADFDEETLKVAPLYSDTQFLLRFGDLPYSPSSFDFISRLAIVLTVKDAPTADTLTLHNLFDQNVWSERSGNYNSINGASPWSGADGKLIDAWPNTDAIFNMTGTERVNSTITIEIYPTDASARKAILDSWLDGNNQGVVVRGISGVNTFYSSDAYNVTYRPELIIEF